MSRLPCQQPSEKKLRPIYELLDLGNNKKALQEAEKVLKKTPTLQCAKALKCLALIRLGKESESLEQLEAVTKEGNLEDAVLPLMNQCYRETHKPLLICDLYERANQKEPGNEDILTNLFLSYVRIVDFNKQKSVAMSLFKVKPKNQYYFWIIVSLLIQTTDKLSDLMPYFLLSTYFNKDYSCKLPPIENSKHDFLRLAEKMVEKHVNEKKIERDQEVLIYLIILEMQGKLKEALNVLVNNELGKKLEMSIFVSKRIDLLLKTEQWAEANECLKFVLLEEMDAWNYILFYLDTVFKLGKGQIYDPENDSCPFNEANNFLEGLKKQNKVSEFQKRGPYLAQLEFYSRLINENQSSEKLSGVVFECMIDYVKVFGKNEACLHDLRPYLHLVDVIKFLAEVYKLVSLKHGEYPETKSQMNLHLTNLELCKVYGIRELLPMQERIHIVSEMIQYFIHGFKFNSDLPPTEPRSNDRYALLAVHMLYELWAESGNPNYLFEAIALGNYALVYSPSNSQIKLLVLKFYHLLGGSVGAHEAYLSLDLKHMQLDTLGYMHVFPLLASAEYTLAKSVLNSTLKFFSHNFKESAEHITFAYKYDALTKIPEFMHIREKLNFSTHYRQVGLEKMLNEIFSASNYSATVQSVKEILPIDNIEWGQLQDNRDFTVLWDVDPQMWRLNQAAIQKTYILDIVFLRLRSLLLHISATSVLLASSESEAFFDIENVDSNNTMPNYFSSKAELHKLTVELESNIRKLKNNPPNSISNRFIAGPPESRLILFIQCNYFDPILNELRFLLCLLPGDYSSKEKANNHLDSIVLFFKEFINTVSNELLKCDNPLSRNKVVQMCALFVEIASFSCIIAGACESVFKKFKQSLNKKNKRKKDIHRIPENHNDLDWRTDVLGKYINAVSSYIKYLETILKSEEKSWKERKLNMGEISVVKDLGNMNELLVIQKISQDVNDTLSNSTYSSIEQITGALKLKLKYINCHKM